MYNILTLNKIAKCGTDILGDNYSVSDSCDTPDAVLVRSASMHDTELPESLLAIARAGAGVNNIPIADCAAKGIVVFNSPGANANAVKELVIAGLLLSSRRIVAGIEWAKTLKGNGDQVGKLVEKGKSNFAGPEITGKTLGIIGLGAIGIKVANAAAALGMKVVGCDPYLSEANKAKLSDCTVVDSNDEVYAVADYITVHVPLNDGTRALINSNTIAKMKDGVRILNYSRDGLVDSADIIEALKSGKISAYVTDFATDDILGEEGVIALPHLGASTPESEDNCAIMAANEVKDYLENGNIVNSVNLPALSKTRAGGTRVCVIAKADVDVEAIKSAAGSDDAESATKGDYTYVIIDNAANADIAVDGVIRVRSI
ncbi:MAG: 3-phosphoglycerate dehydrogenase [Ruminococcus sp.]|nr:3-phosphoglycerate dehydrogenase [Ruminococcus sp.]